MRYSEGSGQYEGNKCDLAPPRLLWCRRIPCVCVRVCVPVLCVVGSLAGRKSSSYESSLDSSPSTEDQALSLASAMANCSATPVCTHTYTHELRMYTRKIHGWHGNKEAADHCVSMLCSCF